MDADAILAAPDETMQRLGIATKGDMLALRIFCETSGGSSIQKSVKLDREQKKTELVSYLSSKRYQSGSKTSNSKKKKVSKKDSQRRVEIGWLHQYHRDDDYRLMRCKDGGGTRVIEVDADSGRFDIISLAKRLFFPGGRN